MLCVLPQDVHSDVTLHIQFTLLEAFCWENDIRVVKVDDVDKLGVALERNSDVTTTTTVEGSNASPEQQRQLTHSDYSCVIVEVRDTSHSIVGVTSIISST